MTNTRALTCCGGSQSVFFADGKLGELGCELSWLLDSVLNEEGDGLFANQLPLLGVLVINRHENVQRDESLVDTFSGILVVLRHYLSYTGLVDHSSDSSILNIAIGEASFENCHGFNRGPGAIRRLNLHSFVEIGEMILYEVLRLIGLAGKKLVNQR